MPDKHRPKHPFLGYAKGPQMRMCLHVGQCSVSRTFPSFLSLKTHLCLGDAQNWAKAIPGMERRIRAGAEAAGKQFELWDQRGWLAEALRHGR